MLDVPTCAVGAFVPTAFIFERSFFLKKIFAFLTSSLMFLSFLTSSYSVCAVASAVVLPALELLTLLVGASAAIDIAVESYNEGDIDFLSLERQVLSAPETIKFMACYGLAEGAYSLYDLITNGTEVLVNNDCIDIGMRFPWLASNSYVVATDTTGAYVALDFHEQVNNACGFCHQNYISAQLNVYSAEGTLVDTCSNFQFDPQNIDRCFATATLVDGVFTCTRYLCPDCSNPSWTDIVYTLDISEVISGTLVDIDENASVGYLSPTQEDFDALSDEEKIDILEQFVDAIDSAPDNTTTEGLLETIANKLQYIKTGITEAFSGISSKIDTIISYLKSIADWFSFDISQDQFNTGFNRFYQLLDEKFCISTIKYNINLISSKFFGVYTYEETIDDETGEPYVITYVTYNNVTTASTLPSFKFTIYLFGYNIDVDLWNSIKWIDTQSLATAKDLIAVILWCGFFISVWRSLPGIIESGREVQNSVEKYGLDYTSFL